MALPSVERETIGWGRLFSPATWPSWILLFYRGIDAWGNADFLRGKMNALKSFIDSPWAVVLALGCLFFFVFDWHTKLWRKLPLRWKPSGLKTKEAIEKKDLEILKLTHQVRLLEREATWLGEMIEDDKKHLGDKLKISVLKQEVGHSHLRDLSPYLSFSFWILNRTLFEIRVAEGPILDKLFWGGHALRGSLKVRDSQPLVLGRGEDGRLELEKDVLREIASKIENVRQAGEEVEFEFVQVQISVAAYTPSGTKVATGFLTLRSRFIPLPGVRR